jgi:hypothetical protein
MRKGGVCEMHIVKKLLLVFFIIVLAIAAVLLSTCSYDCPTCKDHKTIDCTDCDSKGTVACTNCDGSGTLPCFWCNGKGTKNFGVIFVTVWVIRMKSTPDLAIKSTLTNAIAYFARMGTNPRAVPLTFPAGVKGEK